MSYFNKLDLKIIMLTGKSEREARRKLEQGSCVMELQSFIDDYREIDESECTERAITAITETAEHIKNFSDGYFEIADEFNTVVNFDGKQYVLHWTL